ncbi:MAG: beta-ketoacyl synthase N-terminal-like domain-containing protein, partial [Myxococcaceae bacterium]
PDGNMECLGRNDFQVKLRGFRIELGEIEDALSQHPAVRQAAVIVREDRPGDRRLVAYAVTTADVSDGDLRAHLKRTLPDYMVPSGWVRLTKMPLTPSGKIDRKQLPAPDRKRPDLGHELQSPRTVTEKRVCSQWAELLDLDAVGLQDNFFDLGGSSVLAVQAATRLAKELGIEVSPVQLFDSPTPGALSAWIDSNATGQSLIGSDAAARAALGTRTGGRLSDIAIIGMAGRFPGAKDVEAMWKNLLGGVESVSFFKLEEVDPLVPARELNDPAYVRARSVLENVDQFDAAFFGISPREAEVMDPQQRLFLEACWDALERSGYSPETAGGLVGVFGGVYTNSYFATHVTQRPDLSERMGAFNVLTANEKDYVATRVAHRMNLRGPALSIHTACSTSLVAVCEAAKSLQVGECDVALAGGASVHVPVRSGHVYVEGGMLSEDGHCRPFDEKASGTTFSDGVGVVVLKRVDDAVRDGDHIHAVIRGTALNNDGGNKASFTAPNAEGQSAVVALAHARAQVNPRQIGYVEAHGTATPLGDPIEVTGLTRAFRAGTQDNQYCVLGSVKSNFGHLVTAAGVTGLIKASLSLENEVIPPTLHFRKPNPKIDFPKTPFFVNPSLHKWPRTLTARFAGVSSFGVGGTNAHVIVTEAPETAPSSASRPRQLLLLSARSKSALDAMSERLAVFLKQHPEVPLADVAWTLQAGRSIFPYRRAIVAETHVDAIFALENGDPARVFTRHDDADSAEVAFVFPGQGSQYVGMGKALYAREPVFKETVDRCAELLKPHLGRDLRQLLYPPAAQAAVATETLKDTSFTQPALFATSYAMARLWMSLGVKPAAMMGHSVGEFVAACLAGVFAEADALKLVALRGKLMGAQPKGSMLTVRLAAEEVEKKLAAWPTLVIASDNAPALCVVAGPSLDVERFQKEMEAARVQVRMLVTSHAFHSQMMDPAVAPFLEAVKSVKLSEPSIPVVSTATGNWLTPAEAKDPQYWAKQLRARVQFSAAVRALLLKGGIIPLEVGPRGTMTALIRQQVKDKAKQLTVASMADEEGEGRDYLAFLAAMGQLWNGGARPDWRAFVRAERRLRVALPTYPFERKRFWAELPGDRSVQVHVQQTRVPANTVAAAPAARGAASKLINEQLRVMQQQLALLANRRNKGS